MMPRVFRFFVLLIAFVVVLNTPTFAASNSEEIDQLPDDAVELANHFDNILRAFEMGGISEIESYCQENSGSDIDVICESLLRHLKGNDNDCDDSDVMCLQHPMIQKGFQRLRAISPDTCEAGTDADRDEFVLQNLDTLVQTMVEYETAKVERRQGPRRLGKRMNRDSHVIDMRNSDRRGTRVVSELLKGQLEEFMRAKHLPDGPTKLRKFFSTGIVRSLRNTEQALLALEGEYQDLRRHRPYNVEIDTCGKQVVKSLLFMGLTRGPSDASKVLITMLLVSLISLFAFIVSMNAGKLSREAGGLALMMIGGTLGLLGLCSMCVCSQWNQFSSSDAAALLRQKEYYDKFKKCGCEVERKRRELGRKEKMAQAELDKFLSSICPVAAEPPAVPLNANAYPIAEMSAIVNGGAANAEA
jgi:hypothetical protein